MSEQLKPCPFCGEPVEVKDRKHNPYARCGTAGCKGSQLPLLNLDQPDDIAAWNRRPGHDRIVAELAERCRKLQQRLDDALLKDELGLAEMVLEQRNGRLRELLVRLAKANCAR